MECFKCGVSGEAVRLSDVISKEGVVKICDTCLKEEDLPLLKKPTTFQLKESEAPPSVYERLSSIAGIDAKEHKEKIFPSKEKQELKKEEITLRDIVDRNYQKKLEKEQAVAVPRPGLIDNFHWIIMRVRRMKKLTQEQLAEKIGEAELAIKNAEKGVLPENYNELITKLERALGIRIKKEGVVQEEPKPVVKPEELKFDRDTAKTLTIADLKEVKAQQETKEISQEIQEDLTLNEEFKKKLEERKEE
jgi:ribosome-binding protein aMBF1 (putative translation factor)